jgi:hypothetical protein
MTQIRLLRRAFELVVVVVVVVVVVKISEGFLEGP